MSIGIRRLGSLGLGGGAPLWVPKALGADLFLWHRGDLVTASSGAVSAWDDKSSNGRASTQITGADKPTERAAGHVRCINGLPVVEFDGVSDYLAWANIFTALTAAEVFVVGRLDADPPTTGSGGIWDLGTDVNSSAVPFTDGNIYDSFGSTVRKTVGNPAPSLASPFIYNVTSTATEWTARLNGTQIFTTPTNAVAFSAAPTLGRSKNSTILFKGVMAEMFMLSRALTTSERASALSYLRRYAIT